MFKKTVILISAILALGACNQAKKAPTHVPQPSDSLYTAQAALKVYGTQPERALAIVDSALNKSVKPLSITLPGQCISITPSSAQNVLYVAFPPLSFQPASLMAAADEKVYVKNVASVTLEAGKYY